MTEIAADARSVGRSFSNPLRPVLHYRRLTVGVTMVGLLAIFSYFGHFVWGTSWTGLVAQPLEKPSWAHPFGTDAIGRDVLARIIHGGQVSLVVAFVAVGIALISGTAIGIAAGHFGGWVDGVLSRINDGLQAFPPVLLAIMLAAALGPGLRNAMIAVGVALAPHFARLSRSEALRVRHQDYIDAARLSGRPEWWIMARHVLPNSASAIIVFAATGVAQAIIAEASLAFIGLGASPPTPDWGAMLHDGYPYVITDAWLTFFPGAAITLLALGFVFLGDGLRDWLDPRTAE